MTTSLINGIDIEPYIPSHLKGDTAEKLIILTHSIKEAVDANLPIGFSYNKKARLILPHSLYTQDKTPKTTTSVNRKTIGFRTKMKFYNN